IRSGLLRGSATTVLTHANRLIRVSVTKPKAGVIENLALKIVHLIGPSLKRFTFYYRPAPAYYALSATRC
ncbi:MAG: hypothetical protein VXX21_05025, partial [Pseudomonadota bacterium]|nr:hypothetical protein [Pseudomonadota bacterium]